MTTKTHKHEYAGYLHSEWSEVVCACYICGFRIPWRLLKHAILNGARFVGVA